MFSYIQGKSMEVIHSLVRKVYLQGECGAFLVYIGGRIQSPPSRTALDLFEYNAVSRACIAYIQQECCQRQRSQCEEIHVDSW